MSYYEEIEASINDAFNIADHVGNNLYSLAEKVIEGLGAKNRAYVVGYDGQILDYPHNTPVAPFQLYDDDKGKGVTLYTKIEFEIDKTVNTTISLDVVYYVVLKPGSKIDFLVYIAGHKAVEYIDLAFLPGEELLEGRLEVLIKDIVQYFKKNAHALMVTVDRQFSNSPYYPPSPYESYDAHLPRNRSWQDRI